MLPVPPRLSSTDRLPTSILLLSFFFVIGFILFYLALSITLQKCLIRALNFNYKGTLENDLSNTNSKNQYVVKCHYFITRLRLYKVTPLELLLEQFSNDCRK